MTLIHKKGDRYDANNYRSICVGSNMGKLFSSILLQRLIIFRAKFCKDYPNQLGFCKNAQTNDHLLTLSTIIDKYSKLELTDAGSCSTWNEAKRKVMH